MSATLSILGIFNYREDVLDGLSVPEGLERGILIDYIMMECSELEILYPNPDLLKTLIGIWAKNRAHSWERLYQTTVQNYNMIHNYDRYEEWSDTGNRNRSGNNNETISSHGSDSSNSSANGNGTTNNSSTQITNKPGFNVSDGLVATESISNAGNGSSTEHSSSQISGVTDTRTQRGTTETENESNTGKHSGHLYGNIGVTTAAQMLTEERELYKWDVYAAITQEFKERFCVMVY